MDMHRATALGKYAIVSAALWMGAADGRNLTLPQSPREFAPITARFDMSSCEQTDRVEHLGGRLRIVLQSHICFIPPPPTPAYVSLGRLPAGSYEVDLVYAGSGPEQLLDSATLTVRPPITGRTTRAGNDIDLTGSWWHPSEASLGVFIEHSSDGEAFVVVNTYDADGRATFLVLTLRSDPSTFDWLPMEGEILAVSKVAGRAEYEQVGTALLEGNERSPGLQLTLNQRDGSRTYALERIGF